ncbi:LysR substrate-binding domain-containing protein [Sphingomonas jatrophae]|uniref:Transcriptional regulator, LysR family n=1 Tax=Sphingomonas jatrophae TaxID=1166337 RepID=A0A1I6KE68_9SPHN|nr:LysR substrate-binding domain-containing protein [Sphingomonas jatrophae]SFR89532.1 transcriptional regulator, LysR family [Sphingomonas jatrophae]
MPRSGLIELDAVLAVTRHRSFRAAALDLGLSTTALSNGIAKLERDLGVRLFNRTTRSVSLTDAGRRFTEQVGPALGDIHAAMDAARAQQAVPSGVLRINAFATAAREVLAPLLLEYLRRYPQVTIDLVTEGRLVDVVAEGFDFGIRARDFVPSDMIAVPLGAARSNTVVASPAYLAANGTPLVPDDLMRHACIRARLPNGAIYRWQFEKDGQSLQLDVAGPIILDEPSLVRIAALEGLAIGYSMASDVHDDLAAGRLVRLLEDWTPPLAPLCLYYPGRRNASAAARALIDLARARTSGR